MPKRLEIQKGNIVGRLLQQCRIELGLSREKLGEKLGLSFQQIQKYERGISELTISRLKQFAEQLHVPVSVFFNKTELRVAPLKRIQRAKPIVLSPGERRILKMYRMIQEPEKQKTVERLMRIAIAAVMGKPSSVHRTSVPRRKKLLPKT